MEKVEIIESKLSQICKAVLNNSVDIQELFEVFKVRNGDFNSLIKKLAEKEIIQGEETHKFKLPNEIRFKMFLYCWEQLEKEKTPIKFEEAIILFAELNELENRLFISDEKTSSKIICNKLKNYIKINMNKKNFINYVNSFYTNNARRYGKDVIEVLIEIYRGLLMDECRSRKVSFNESKHPQNEETIFSKIPEVIMKKYIIPYLRLNSINNICQCYNWNRYKDEIENRYIQIYNRRKRDKNSSYRGMNGIPEEIRKILVSYLVRKTDFSNNQIVNEMLNKNFLDEFIFRNIEEILNTYFLLNCERIGEKRTSFEEIRKLMYRLADQLPEMSREDQESLRIAKATGLKTLPKQQSKEALKKLLEMIVVCDRYCKYRTVNDLEDKVKYFKEYLDSVGISIELSNIQSSLAKGISRRLFLFGKDKTPDININGNVLM